MDASVDKLITVYESLMKQKAAWEMSEDDVWHSALRRIATEWKLLTTVAHAAGSALVGEAADGRAPMESGASGTGNLP